MADQPDYNHEPRNRAGVELVRVLQLRCPYTDHQNACRRVFINRQRRSNRQVRHLLWAHLTVDHIFGEYMCCHAQCGRRLRNRIFANATEFWAHIEAHKVRDEAQKRANPEYNTATYHCPICTGDNAVHTTSQALIHTHLAQKHHPGRFVCTRSNCHYGSNEQHTVVQHARNPRHR